MRRSRRSTGKPVVHLYCLCWNEAALIPHFLRHYDALVTRFFVFDHGSTDDSVAQLQAHPRVEVAPFAVTGDSFVAEEQRLSDTAWQGRREEADWVIVVDMDEFLDHPAPTAYLNHCKRRGITAIRSLGYDMVAESFPDGARRWRETVTRGLRSPGHDKLCIFDPRAIEATHFGPGRHGAAPSGRVVYPASPHFSMLHYKHLGLDYCRRRHALLATGLREGDKARGWGRHYLRSEAEVEAEFRRMLAVAAPVPGLPGGPRIRSVAAEEALIRASGRFDEAWYLAQYPDVAAAGIDPVLHYHHHGWREGRRPGPDFDPERHGPRDGAAGPAPTNPYLRFFIESAA